MAKTIVLVTGGFDLTIGFNDEDGSAANAIRMTRNIFRHDLIIFANGGDRTEKNIPEMSVEDENLIFEFAVGGEDKKNSSSWILKRWSNDLEYLEGEL
jgi:UDP-N-acetylmuramyl tripeptide synthase